MLKEDQRILAIGAQKIGITLTQEQIEIFFSYLELLIKWNQKINLTSLESPREIIINHFLDALTCVKIINLYYNHNIDQIKLIDVGTGAGLPGIPIKIALPSIKLFLLDSRKKKVIFLKNLVEQLDLEKVEIYEDRAEVLGKCQEYREKYDIAISRAVAALNTLSEYCLPLVKVGGLFIAQKGKSYQKELDKGLKAVQLLKGKLIKVEEVQIPYISQVRYLIIIKKNDSTPLEYPRRKGIPKKRPLYF